MAAATLKHIHPGMSVRTEKGDVLGKVMRVAPCFEVVGCGYFTPWQLEPCPALLVEVEPEVSTSGQARYLPFEAVRAVKRRVVIVTDPAHGQVWHCPG